MTDPAQAPEDQPEQQEEADGTVAALLLQQHCADAPGDF